MSNAHLHNAKRQKNDCFYTRREDVDKELAHYEEQLEGRWVYMPFDTEKSAFWQYFKDNFHKLKLKHITATSWYQDNPDGKGHRLDYDGTEETDVILQGNGSFDSEECTEIMKACDLVCSNPPFSRLRDVIKWLNYDGRMKDFILLAPKTATQYQDMFWRIVEGQIYIGINYPTVFDGKEGDVPALSNWLNTVGVHKHKQLNLTKTYSEDKYPAYDNYPQAINVDWIKDIPYDYDGVMGVPITWLDGYYDGYEIVGLNNDSRTNDFKYLVKGTPVPDKNGVPRFGFFCKGKQVYTRILIRRK